MAPAVAVAPNTRYLVVFVLSVFVVTVVADPALAQDNVPEPLVLSTSPEPPSAEGSVHVTLAAIAAGA